MLGGGLAVSTAAWVAPSVLTFDRVAAATGSGTAELPTVSNGALLISAPPTIQEGTPTLDSNTNTFVFLETCNVVLTSNLIVNRVTAGSNFGGNSNENATIPIGTEVCSFYVHGDRLDDNGTLTGTMTFGSSTILGLIYRTTQLNNSSFLRAPGTTYFNAPMESSDKMWLDLTTGANSLRWRMRFGGALDGIRVITDCGGP
jgi:hypothetical protein